MKSPQNRKKNNEYLFITECAQFKRNGSMQTKMNKINKKKGI